MSGGLVSGREVAVEVRLARQLGNGLADQVDGYLGLTGLVGHDAEQVQDIGLAWMVPEYFPIEGLCLRQISTLMELKSLFERDTQVVQIILTLFRGRGVSYCLTKGHDFSFFSKKGAKEHGARRKSPAMSSR
jgi:hypothetical protein